MSEPVEQVIRIAEKATGIPFNGLLINNAPKYITEYSKIASDQDFYQWFCQLWQGFVCCYSTASAEKWVELPMSIAPALASITAKPKLVSMCFSLILASLLPYESAMLFTLKVSIEYCSGNMNREFCNWLIDFISQNLDTVLSCTQKEFDVRPSLMLLFRSMDEWSETSVSVLSKCLSSPEFIKVVAQKDGDAFPAVVEKAFAGLLRSKSFFLFQEVYDNEAFKGKLSDDFKELLKTHYDGTVDDFDAFVKAHQDLMAGFDIEEHRERMMELTFLSIAEKKKEMRFSELAEVFSVPISGIKKILIDINISGIASVLIDSSSEDGSLRVMRSQPRVLTSAIKQEMGAYLKSLLSRLN